MSLIHQQADIGEGWDVAAEDKQKNEFVLSMPAEDGRRLASGWLWLGIASLVGAGLFAILLVL